MMIHVIYKDKRYDFVKDSRLDELIRSDSILMFKRQSGWVRIGIDPIRMKDTSRSEENIERRHAVRM